MLLHLIADFGAGDLAFAEVIQRLKLYLPEAEIVATPVPPFATLAAGFCVAQLGLGDAPAGTVIFHNVAPRKDDIGVRRDNDGERLVWAELPNGVQVVGVHAGFAFSFVRDRARALRYVDAPSAGSQFRSRDLFPEAVARVVRGDAGVLAGPLALDAIPEVPPDRIAFIDGFGNLKTTIGAERAPESGSLLQVRIGEGVCDAMVAGGGFSVPDGALAFSPGSSGWGSGAAQLRWMELFHRGGSAWEAFGRPEVGDRIEIEVVSLPA
jgi:S-adenosylmethionine hydrolase